MTWAVFSDEHRLAIEEIEQSKSERIVAIVGGAVLDNTLYRTLAERLRNDKDTVRRLLKVGGPLGNTQPKIELLFLLGAFEEPSRDAMVGLAEVRNFFAHNLNTSFASKDERITKPFSQLTLHVGQMYYPHHLVDEESKNEIEATGGPREVFLVNLKFCLIYLMRDRVSHRTHTNIPLTEKEIRARVKGLPPGERPQKHLST